MLDQLEPRRLLDLVQTDRIPSRLAMRARLKDLLGLDRAIVFTVLARVWSSLAGLVTIVLIARYLTSAEQGYYYTFGSLVALQIVFELGFSFVVLQMASHECAHLSIAEDGAISGNPVAHARLASVLQKSVRWYSIAALLMMLGLIPIGIHFFSTHPSPGQIVAWRLPWCMVVVAASLAFQIDPIFSFLEGCGYVPQVARARLLQSLSGSLLAWIALSLHFGLYAPAMLITGQVIAGGSWIYTRRRLLLPLIRYVAGEHRIEWWTEVWPFQWRIAISWVCGYFIFQLFNPVLFAYWGPVSAGQMGMSLSISNALTAVAIAWINTKAAPFGIMIARKEYAKLDEAFFRAVTHSFTVCVAGAITIWCIVLIMNVENVKFAQRVLSPTSFGMLMVAMVLNHLVFSEALYLRAHKQEKFLLVSVLNALFMLASAYPLGKRYGAAGMMTAYLAGSTVIGLGLGTFTFLKYRKKWHAE